MKMSGVLVTMALVIVLLTTIVDYIYLQHKSRGRFVQLQELTVQEHDLNAEWGRLQLEHSTLVNNSSVELKAKNLLEMNIPDNNQILSIKR